MVLTKCEKGHFFDHDKFAECPYCALEKTEVEEQTQSWSKNMFEATETVMKDFDLSE